MNRYLVILFLCLFIVMIGNGIILPVLAFYIERLALAEGATLSEASFQVGILTGIFALMQFFFAPLWGKWSDHLGRRPLFLIGIGGYAMSMFLFGVGTNLVVLYVARILGGILSAAVLPVANAYVADVTSEKDRGRGMAWMGSAVSLGVVVGPALSSFLPQLGRQLKYPFGHFYIDGFSIPFFAAALLSILTLVAAMRWLPETVNSQLVKSSIQQTNFDNTLPAPPNRLFIFESLRPFLVMAFLNQLALSTFEGTFALHAKQDIQLGPYEMSFVFMVCGFVMAAVPGFICSWLIGRSRDRFLLPAGFILMGASLAALMTAQRFVIILLYVALFALGVALISPILATLVSRFGGNRPGAALGRLNAANNLGLASGPALGGFLLAWKIHIPYLMTALLLVAAAVYMIVSILIHSNIFRSSKHVNH